MTDFSKPELSQLYQIIEAELQGRQSVFHFECQKLWAELAAKGIGASGAAIAAFERIGLEEADKRCDLIVRLIKTNVMETTYRLDAGDLLAVFDAIRPFESDLVKPAGDACRVMGADAEGRAASVRSAIESKRKKARVEVEFFAGAPRRANTGEVQVHGNVGHFQTSGHSNVNQIIGFGTGGSAEAKPAGDATDALGDNGGPQ